MPRADRSAESVDPKEPPWGAKSATLVFVVSFLSILVPSLFLAGSSLAAATQYFIAEALLPIPFFAFFLYWLRKKNIEKQEVGLCLPEANILLVTLVAIVIAAIFKGADLVLFFASLADFDWSRLAFVDGPFFAVSSGIGRVIITPLMEEVVYRGVIYGYLRSRLGWPLGLVVQALLFTLVHANVYQGDWTMILFYFAFALGFGGLYQYYRSLYPAVVCHGALNYLDATIQVF